MNNLFVIFEPLFHGYFVDTLVVLSFLSIISAVLVITTKNPVTSVLFLIMLFFSVACYLIAIGLNFIGLSYLLVYVGAVSILFLFILMLINIRVSELISETQNSIPLVIIVTLIFINAGDNVQLVIKNTKNIYTSTYNNWENNMVEYSHITSIGNVMYTNYGIWLILASIILLLAMVGAIVITIKQKSLYYEFNNYTLPSLLK